ncbi:unnamed protein product [Nesidiocoris tenuis]|uniref:AMP-dependent synthetase/ligase domain-containing protein n=1 Tax=Nesidiocoris tenuis TaxID=355587 RepID=A0A6H5G837_9HEMI|nr:unnamed protein product [Nesidiocoris tenuis]
MICELKKSLQGCQTSKTAVKFYDGVSWTKLSYCELNSLVDIAGAKFREISGGQKTCWGLCVAPCLELPAFILGCVPSHNSLIICLPLHLGVKGANVNRERWDREAGALPHCSSRIRAVSVEIWMESASFLPSFKICVSRTDLNCGEPFPSLAEINNWNPQGDVRIFNTYGITEVSCWATLMLVWPNASGVQEIDIGDPLSDTLLKTELHGDLHHLLIGSSSRICAIGGESFNELENRKPIFRPTGDLFKIIDGKYCFVCRADAIVKRFGRKVDLSQIERSASQLGIDCAVVAEGEENCRLRNHQVEFRVLMFVVKKSDSNERMAKLKKSLPSHCWPDEVFHVDAFPLSSHGKVDKKRLVADYSAKPKNFARSTFSELWNFFTIGTSSAEPSGSNRSGFISSGGDSYSAVLFISSLEDRGVRCSSTDLLVKLMKDATFDECFDCLLPVQTRSSSLAPILAWSSVWNQKLEKSYPKPNFQIALRHRPAYQRTWTATISRFGRCVDRRWRTAQLHSDFPYRRHLMDETFRLPYCSDAFQIRFIRSGHIDRRSGVSGQTGGRSNCCYVQIAPRGILFAYSYRFANICRLSR